jgi:hypothetical protein
MIRTLILVLVATFAFAAEDKPEPKSPATILYEKALADNSKDVEKTYAVYLKALEVANAKILKALEVAKNDLNDPKKGKLSITERARALEELEGKIKALKGGELATVVAEKAKDSGDLLGDKEKAVASKPDPKSPIIGKWQRVDENSKESNGPGYKCMYEFAKDGSGANNISIKVHWKLKEGNTYIVTFDDPNYKWVKVRVIEIDADAKGLTDTSEGEAGIGTKYIRVDDKITKSLK